MNRYLLVAIACLNVSISMHATSRPATGQEARDLKLAIEASLRQAEIDKKRAEAELKQAIVESKQPAPKPTKPVPQMTEQEQLALAIELSLREAKDEKAEQAEKMPEMDETEKRRILNYLRAAETVMPLVTKGGEPVSPITDIISSLRFKPYTIATLQSVLDTLLKRFAAYPSPLDEATNKIRYEIDRMKGIPGISFRDYYKKNKAKVDEQILDGDLDLSNKNFTDLTDLDDQHIPGLGGIRRLYINQNKLTEIPESIGNLRMLVSIDLSANYLLKIPESIGNLRQLIRLFLEDNKISALPGNLAHLAALTDLFLDRNRFTMIPAVIQYLHALRDFNAADNKISVIPDWIGHLVNLRSINLNSNKISELPDMSKLVRLGTLNLSGNEFTTVSENLTNLIHHANIDLRNNPMPYTDAELRNILGAQKGALWHHLIYKDHEQEAGEKALIDSIKEGNADAVQKAFTIIIAGRIKTGRYLTKKIDISKIRDAEGDNLLQIVLKTLLQKIAAINKQMKPKEAVDAIHDAQVNYTRIYLILTQFGGPKVQEMMLARNKAGQDLFQAAVGNLTPDSFFVQTIREYNFKPTPAGQHLTPFKIMRRHHNEENEAEKLEREQAEQRERLKPNQ